MPMRSLSAWLLVATLVILSGAQKPTFTLVTSISNLQQDIESSKGSVLGSAQNMIVFGPAHLEQQVMKKRQKHKTVYVPKDLNQLSKHWSYSYLKSMQSDQEKALFQNRENFEFRRTLLSIYKMFFVAEALRLDKFQSQFIVWTDPQIHLNVTTPETLLRKFYELIQPRWLFLTDYSQSQTQYAPNEGEERYIERKLRKGEVVLPYMMGGSVQIVRDIKNSYQSLLRILFEDKRSKFERNSLSLMAIRFPSLIPYTMNINFKDIENRVFKYSDVYRLPKQNRRFNGVFNQNGQFSIREDQIKPSFPKSNHTGGEMIVPYVQGRPISEPMKVLKGMVRDIVSRKYVYKVFINLLDALVLLSLIAVKLVLVSKNRAMEKVIRQDGNKPKNSHRFSALPTQTGRFEPPFEARR